MKRIVGVAATITALAFLFSPTFVRNGVEVTESFAANERYF